jgi:hypothetical protein
MILPLGSLCRDILFKNPPNKNDDLGVRVTDTGGHQNQRRQHEEDQGEA